MAFNFGAFAGGVAKAGLQTYQMLSEEEERELIKEERRRKLQQERDIQNAAKVYDQVGTSDTVGNAVQTSAESQGALPTGSSTPAPTSLRAALSENQGALPTGAQSTRPVLTQEQADKEFARRLSAIDPRLGRQARIETAQIRELERKETNQNKFNSAMDNLDKDLATIQSTVESKGMQGVYELAKKNGLNVKYIQPKNESSLATVQLIGKDGKVERIFTSASDAAEALSEVRMNRFVERDALPLLGDAKSIMDAMNARRTAAREDRKVDIQEREATDKGAYYKSEADFNRARIDALAADRESKNAAKPFMDKYAALSVADQQGAAGAALLNQAASAVAAKTGDFRTVAGLTAYGQMNSAYAKAVEEAAKTGSPPPKRAEFEVQFGFAPAAVQQGQQAKVDKLIAEGKLAEAEKLIQQHNAVFRYSPLTMPKGQNPSAATGPVPSVAPPSALPVNRTNPAMSTLDTETQEIEQGKRKAYSATAQAEMTALAAKRNLGNENALKSQRDIELAKSKDIARAYRP